MSEKLLTELDLERPPVQRGRKTASYDIKHTRDLTPADFEVMDLPKGIRPPSLTRIHGSHHALARCLAAGMSHTQAGLVTGYSAARIGVLSRDPAFKELLDEYTREAKSIFADLGERIKNLSLDAIEKLHDRLHEKPEDFSVGMLLDVVKAMADRSGFGPGQEVRLNISPGVIDRPPRETHEEWEARRKRELAELASLEPPTGATN